MRREDEAGEEMEEERSSSPVQEGSVTFRAAAVATAASAEIEKRDIKRSRSAKISARASLPPIGLSRGESMRASRESRTYPHFLPSPEFPDRLEPPRVEMLLRFLWFQRRRTVCDERRERKREGQIELNRGPPPSALLSCAHLEG